MLKLQIMTAISRRTMAEMAAVWREKFSLRIMAETAAAL
jgi:hypothetical protein